MKEMLVNKMQTKNNWSKYTYLLSVREMAMAALAMDAAQ